MRKKEIYILEDDEGIREMLHFLMESAGYSVRSFASVSSFKARMLIRFPDLLLLDIWLPDGDGRSLCRELRGETATTELPIVLMTANSTIVKGEGASDFISKPFDIKDLVLRIERLLTAV